ncbi:hypothetical protein [Thermococcus thioreducens]|uniref:Uncharacterized protein n=1 Tax=Thermococcus thioreducens TaxID=277988 RepID=A0A1I0PCE0_9EURY|nr:hypothetical protein [Thermococcus thioreducens]SEW11947.1 hypothetical protein SAMN05216170_1706 [Thermococcus thioreducens]
MKRLLAPLVVLLIVAKHGIKQMMIEDVWGYYEKYVLGQRK